MRKPKVNTNQRERNFSNIVAGVINTAIRLVLVFIRSIMNEALSKPIITIAQRKIVNSKYQIGSCSTPLSIIP